jgi:predicted nucleotidyltransferase
LDSVKVISSPDAEIESFLRVYALFLRGKGARHAYLFGSRSRGNYSPYSDIDILVEVDESDEPRRDRALRFFPSSAPAGVDVFVFTRKEILTSEFASKALQESRRLF